jgi:hypothetical protein
VAYGLNRRVRQKKRRTRVRLFNFVEWEFVRRL